MSTFRDTLKRLFSRNVIIKRIHGNSLKAFDVNKAQSQGSPNTYNYRTRWRNGRRFNSVTGYGSGFTNQEIESLRRQMYVDYELMDTDAIISSALDLYSDEITSNSFDNQLLLIRSDDIKLKKILHNLFYDILNIEFNLWSWVRTTCKYGDSFLYLDLRENYGIVNIVPIHPALIIREEGSDENPYSYRFRYEGDSGFYTQTNIFEEYEIAHFRILTDTNFLPYGRSLIEPGRKEFKRMSLMEDAMLIHRIMRAPERRLFKIGVGNLAPEDIEAYMEQIVEETKKIPYIDPETGDYNLRFNMMNQIEDIYMPVRGTDDGTNIDTLPGLNNEGQIEDVEYVKNKLLASLKIPKAYLGFDEGTAKANLSSEDIRFAKTVERIQKMIVSELYKIAIIHLRIQGFTDEDLLNFELELTSPSLIYERQKLDILGTRLEAIQTIKENNLFSDKYIYEVIFGMSEDEWKSDRELIVDDLKFAFRLQQIKDEGNDPSETGRTFGTAHDIATMQMASKFGASGEDVKKFYTPDGREENDGQPKRLGNFETKRDQDFGRDPVGRRASSELPKPGATESLARTLKKLESKFKKTEILSELNLYDDDLIVE